MIVILHFGKINDIGKIKIETSEVNLNADQKRQRLGRLQSINDGNLINSLPSSLNCLKRNQSRVSSFF